MKAAMQDIRLFDANLDILAAGAGIKDRVPNYVKQIETAGLLKTLINWHKTQ